MLLSISKTFQGAIVISAIINGQYVDNQYMSYTLREAKQLFKSKYLPKTSNIQYNETNICPLNY